MGRASRPRKPAHSRHRKAVSSSVRCYSSASDGYESIPRDHATELVAFGFATWINYLAIRLHARAEMRLRQSFILTLAFLRKLIEGDSYAVRLWEMWQATRKQHLGRAA